MYHKRKNNQIQFRKIIKANAFGKRLLSMRERNVKSISVVVSHELDTFSIQYGNFELFRYGLHLIKQKGKNPKFYLCVFHCEKDSSKLQGRAIKLIRVL